MRWEEFSIPKHNRGGRKYPDKQSVINEITRRYDEGFPVNYSAVRTQDDALRRRCTSLFGGYGNAVEAAGFDYDDFRTDTNMASYYGIIFENVVKELFSELSIGYGEYGDKSVNPDLVLSYNRWIDVKLSEWSVDNKDCATIEKYLPYCRSLSIVYLRGRTGERMYNDKIRLINVSEYVKQLPRAKRGYFYAKINEIMTKVCDLERKVAQY